jgi:hypothetical protein
MLDRAGRDIGKLATEDVYSAFQAALINEAQATAIVRAAGRDTGARGIGLRYVLDGKSGGFISNIIDASKGKRNGRTATSTCLAMADEGLWIESADGVPCVALG